MGGHLDATSEFEGSLRFSETMRIDGRFSGDIEGNGHLIVGEKALVKADIRASIVTVAGKVEGTIRATERVEIFKEGRLTCDIVTPSIRIEDGAIFQGQCETTPRADNAAPKPPLDMSELKQKLGS